MDVSIIIVSWNVRDMLRACLSSIYRFTEGVTFEIFVVDNGSQDGSCAMIKTDFPQVTLIDAGRNLGFAKANNIALARAEGRYILLLNPDTEIMDNAVKKMVEFMVTHRDADALGSRLIYGDGALQRNCRHFPSLFTDLMETFYLDHLFPHSPVFNRYRMGGWDHNGTREVDQPCGACLLFNRRALERVGFMDERFFMYYDEVDLCYRVKKSGGKIYFTDTITVMHHANQSSSQDALRCDEYRNYSRLKFFEKHYGWWSVYILTLNLAIRTALVWIAFGLSHILVRRPRDMRMLKDPVTIMWNETGKYFRGHQA